MYGKISNAGNEEKAIQIAQQKLEQCEREGKKKPSEMCPGTTVHRLAGEYVIKQIIRKNLYKRKNGAIKMERRLICHM